MAFSKIKEVKTSIVVKDDSESSFDITNLFEKAISIFSRCDKKGSIPVFTEHLRSNPNDFKALIWRGKAYDIIGDKKRALSDYKRAENISSEHKQLFARALLEESLGNQERCRDILGSIVSQYPDFAEAKAMLALVLGDIGRAILLMISAIDIGMKNEEMREAWFPWACYSLGNMFSTHYPDDIASALQYYRMAVQYCSSLTVAHIGISECSIYTNDLHEARMRYDIARKLNPLLVHWENFEEFAKVVQEFRTNITKHSKEVIQKRKPDTPRQQLQQSSSQHAPADGGQQQTGKSGRKSGKDGSGSSSDSDSETDDLDEFDKLDENGKRQHGNDMFQKLKSGVNESKGHHRYHRTKCDNFWVSRDTAGHGGAFLKIYKNNSSMTFVGSVTQKVFKGKYLKEIDKILQKGLKQKHFDLMTKKHESRTGTNLKR